MPPPDSAHNTQSSWLAPTAVHRARLVERSGKDSRVMRAVPAVVVAVVVWTAVDRPWALLVLAAAALVPAFAPLIRHARRPEYWDFAIGTIILTTVAVTAAITGGPFSPIAYLLPSGLVVCAMRSSALATGIGGLVAGTSYLAACLIASPSTLFDHPLGTAALLSSVAIVTMGSTVLAGAELAYRNASVLDPLTGLLNRQALEDRFEELRSQASVIGAPICLVLFDLDRFKSINDEHGHDVGDAVLREVAYQVRKSLRTFELVYRIGGEEFLIVLPGIGQSQGAHTAELLRSQIGRVRLAGDIAVTASFGVSSGTGGKIEFETLYRRADEALYHAKRNGRDRVGVSNEVAPPGGESRIASPV